LVVNIQYSYIWRWGNCLKGKLFELHCEASVCLMEHKFRPTAWQVPLDYWDLHILTIFLHIWSEFGITRKEFYHHNATDAILSLLWKLEFWTSTGEKNLCFLMLCDFLAQQIFFPNGDTWSYFAQHLHDLCSNLLQYFPSINNRNTWVQNPFSIAAKPVNWTDKTCCLWALSPLYNIHVQNWIYMSH
jgi:hypothetical protein